MHCQHTKKMPVKIITALFIISSQMQAAEAQVDIWNSIPFERADLGDLEGNSFGYIIGEHDNSDFRHESDQFRKIVESY